jgi:hypothetical protein
MSNAFSSVVELYVALGKIEDCLAKADAATDSRVVREEVMLAGSYGCRAFGALQEDDGLWNALRNYYKEPAVRKRLADMLPNNRFPEFAVPRVVELLVKLGYRPPTDAELMAKSAQQYTEDLNMLLFDNGRKVAGSDLVLGELVDAVTESVHQVTEATCDLLKIARSRPLTEEEIQQFRSNLARVSKVGIAIIATAIQVDPVQAFAIANMPGVVELFRDIAHTAGTAMLALGPATIIREIDLAISIYQSFKLNYGPGSNSRLETLNLRSTFEGRSADTLTALRTRVASSVQYERNRNFAQNVRDRMQQGKIRKGPNLFPPLPPTDPPNKIRGPRDGPTGPQGPRSV